MVGYGDAAPAALRSASTALSAIVRANLGPKSASSDALGFRSLTFWDFSSRVSVAILKDDRPQFREDDQ